jgi:hypothetical protein
MVYNPQNHWGSGIFQHPVFKITRKHNISEFISSGEGREGALRKS